MCVCWIWELFPVLFHATWHVLYCYNVFCTKLGSGVVLRYNTGEDWRSSSTYATEYSDDYLLVGGFRLFSYDDTANAVLQSSLPLENAICNWSTRHEERLQMTAKTGSVKSLKLNKLTSGNVTGEGHVCRADTNLHVNDKKRQRKKLMQQADLVYSNNLFR